MTTENPPAATRLERVLAYMVAGTVGLSILAFFALIIGTAVGAGANNGFNSGIWPAVLVLPRIALPLGFALVIVLLVASVIRRGRDARENRQS